MRNEEKQWLLFENESETGPFTYAQLQERFQHGEINGDTLCYPKTWQGILPMEPLRYHFPAFKRSVERPVGSQVKTDEQQSAENKLIQCPMCKRDVSPYAVSCPHCGHPLAVQNNPAVEQTKQTNLWLRVIIFLICVPVVVASLRGCVANW